MFKPRLGFYITENFPKSPPITEKNKDSIVVYDLDEFLNLPSDEALWEYVAELIEHFNLDWEVKELAMAITFHIILDVYPQKVGVSKKEHAKRIARFLNEDYLREMERRRNDA